jgi:5-methylcytosine-specific restriction endonuclease McrA
VATKVLQFYLYPFAHQKEAKFAIRYEGNRITYCCERLNKRKKRIRTAWALLIRGTVITAQPGTIFKLNKAGTVWTFYDCLWASKSRFVAKIPAYEVYWALGTSPLSADIETFQNGRIARWTIVKSLRECDQCRAVFEPPSDGHHAACDKCEKEQARLSKTMSIEDWTHMICSKRPETTYRQDRSSNLRFLRTLAAEGCFTRSEFKALCLRYGNVCLCCGKRRVLVPDHVIPLSRGGSNDISNIQPLCGKCNASKGARTIDYRKKLTKGHNDGS